MNKGIALNQSSPSPVWGKDGKGAESGMLMPGRSYSSESYRFGFNGKENDNEIKGTGNSVDFGARIYDPRAVRWLSVDPLQQKYTWLTPYQFCANNPIIAIDPDGKEIYVIIANSGSDNPEIRKCNAEKIINRLSESAMGEAIINEFINNPQKDIYITIGTVDNKNAMATTERHWDDGGNLNNPETVDIGQNSYVVDEEFTDFECVQIDKNKENYFIVLDEKKYGSDYVSDEEKVDGNEKEGAKVLGHEMKAHLKNKKTSGDEEHNKYGQAKYGSTDPGSDAETLTVEVDESKRNTGKYTTKEQGHGKFKLTKKDEKD